MRVAHVRGTVLRRWDVANYVPPGFDVEFFVSRANGLTLADTGLPIRSLPSPGDALARLPPRVRAAAYMTIGSAEYLGGPQGNEARAAGPGPDQEDVRL